MTDAKFTPGPWVAHETGRARSGLPEHEIHWSDIGECVAEVVHGAANADLISAAPELYEALEIILADYLDASDEWDKENQEYATTVIDQSRAALAKARGKPQ